MKELVNKLNEARKAYYFGEQSPLSDREYDALYDRLVSMEVGTGIILPGSPTYINQRLYMISWLINN